MKAALSRLHTIVRFPCGRNQGNGAERHLQPLDRAYPAAAIVMARLTATCRPITAPHVDQAAAQI